MKRNIAALCLILTSLSLAAQVIAPSDPRITTHTLSSGNVSIGISSAGGGYLNMIHLPGKGDIMDQATDMYGRGGQSAMRDQLRSGKYNPTMAGFNETLGTPSLIIQNEDSLVISARQCALWHGDGKYDYIRWENIGADPYNNDQGNSDIDGIDEEDLEGKQLAEVGSEFDYYGIYENYMGRDSISIPCFRHYYEYRFIREPGHCMSQFGPGTEVFNENMFYGDLSASFPEGSHPAGNDDISGLIKVWSLRNDVTKWNPAYRHLLSSTGEWIVEPREGDLAGAGIHGSGSAFQPLVIIADSAAADSGLALGLYRPESRINTHVIAGVRESDGEISYEDDRTLVARILEQPLRAKSMSKYGFYMQARGMLNRKRTDPGIYEMVRSEFYILVGTPAEIVESARKIHSFTLHQAPGKEWDFNSDLEGWSLVKSLSGEVRDGILELEITGSDPYMISPAMLDVEAALHSQVLVRMKNGTNTSSGRLFWTTDTQGSFNASHSQSFPLLPNDGEIREYAIDLSDHHGWSGTIRQIRLDPSNDANSGRVDIDYIGIQSGSSVSAEEHSDLQNPGIYPVPATDHFMVELPEPSLIAVYDSMGRQLHLGYSENNCRIETSHWKPGFYTVRIQNPHRTSIQKLIIE